MCLVTQNHTLVSRPLGGVPALPGNGGEACCRAALAAWSTRVNTDLGQHANGRIHTRSECRDMFCSQIWDVVLGDASVVSERSY